MAQQSNYETWQPITASITEANLLPLTISRIRCSKAEEPEISRQRHGSMLPYSLRFESPALFKRGVETLVRLPIILI